MVRVSRRRMLQLSGVSGGVVVAGCVGGSEYGDEGERDGAARNTSSDPGRNDTTSAGEFERVTEVHGTLVEETPSEDPVVEHDDDRITGDEVIQELLDRARDPDGRVETVTMSGGEFEQVSVDENEFEQERLASTAAALEELPFVEDSPPGVYVRHPEQVVAVGYGGVDNA